MVAYDTTRPYELRFWEPYDIVVAGIPRRLLSSYADPSRAVTAHPVGTDTSSQRLVRTFLMELAASGPADGDELSRRDLADAFVSWVVSALAGLARPHDAADTLITRVQAYCLENLNDPELDVRSVAAAHRISVRYLHKIAREAGINLGGWIRGQRLRRIREDLADPALVHRSPAAIAARWGILDAKHLSRRMRSEFDETPAQIGRSVASLRD